MLIDKKNQNAYSADITTSHKIPLDELGYMLLFAIIFFMFSMLAGYLLGGIGLSLATGFSLMIVFLVLFGLRSPGASLYGAQFDRFECGSASDVMIRYRWYGDDGAVCATGRVGGFEWSDKDTNQRISRNHAKALRELSLVLYERYAKDINGLASIDLGGVSYDELLSPSDFS